MEYRQFLSELDKRLEKYFSEHKMFVKCSVGCSFCCEKGDYPLSQIELEYLMQGFISLNNVQKLIVQNNIKNIKKGGACPFLIDKKCSVYAYRPIICRVHGLAYLCSKGVVKVPYCVYENKNYAKVYKEGIINIDPVSENLELSVILKDVDCGEIRNLVDWIEKPD